LIVKKVELRNSRPFCVRIRASLEDVAAGRVQRGTADELIKELKLEG
jgi:hypothetical protein